MLARCKYQAQLDEYGRFSKKMGLKQERERIYLDMKGRVATNTKEQNARYTPEMIKNASKDLREFGKYKNIIGPDAGSLAGFRQMKYNDSNKYKLLKSYVKSVDKGMITKLCGFDNYVKTYNEIEKTVIGAKTSNDIRITGQSEHFMERVIGTLLDPKNEKPRSGVSVEDIIDALTNPLDIKPIKIDKDGKKSQKFIGEQGTISVNPDTGVLVQCNPTDSDLVKRYKK